MQLTLTGVLTDLLKSRLPTTKLGIVVRGIQNISPVPIAAAIANITQVPLAVAAVGYPIDDAPDLEVATTIEAAVGWRNQASHYAGRILVFVPGEVDKLGSLANLDPLTTRDVALHLIQWAEHSLGYTPPQQRFWAALRSQAATLPFQMLLEFTVAIAASNQAINAIPRELWRLGFLEDGMVFNLSVNVEERLDRNRELITAIGQLSDNSRKRMNQVLRRARGQEQEQLRHAAQLLRKFFEQGNNESLDGLRFDDVEKLIQAGNIEPPEGDDPPPTRRETVLRGQELTLAVAGQIVRGGSPEAIEAYLDIVRRHMEEEQGKPNDPIDNDVLIPISGGRSIQTNVTKYTVSLRDFIKAFCTNDYWGGVTQANQHNMRDIIHRFTAITNLEPVNPRISVRDEQSLVELLKIIDQGMEGVTTLVTEWNQMEMARSELIEHIDLLIAEPIALLYSNSPVRAAVDRYLDHYAALLQQLHGQVQTLSQRYVKTYRNVLQGLLRLDVIFVLTANDSPSDKDHRQWKATLTPLHPLHLWRFRTILERAGTLLSELEQEQLMQALPKLPHLLHFVAAVDERGNKITLPQAGSLETLPIYENRTNRYLGSDGVEFLSDLLKSWLAFAPYSQPQIRLAIIDIPYLPDAIREVWRFMRGRNHTQVVIDVYRTRSQSVLEHLSEMEFEAKDSDIADILIAGSLSLNLHDPKPLREVVKALEQRPVHLVYSFDQSSYDLTRASKTGHHIVSPLVVTYKYGYDEGMKKGEISPSSDAESGIFADYHHLVNQAIDLPENQSFQVQIGRGSDVDALNSLLSSHSAHWLAVADRTLLGYAPRDAVPLVEQLQGRREVAVWAYATSRSVRQFIDILRDFNLLPHESHIAHLMQKYGHIAAGGLFSAVRATSFSSSQRSKQRKSLIGTVVAAHWYTQCYPGALIASLDSDLARQWLFLQAQSRERADLIGLREDEQGNLIIDVIEVKAVEQASKEVQVTTNSRTRQTILSGPAIDQLHATITAVEPIFTPGTHNHELFTQARREALKYQLYRECFRELHSNDDQYRWYTLLNRAFAVEGQNAPVSVSCRGIVVHVHFEDHGDTDLVTDSRAPITLVRLRDEAIQRLVGPEVPGSTTPVPPPTPPPAPNSGGSAPRVASPLSTPPAGSETSTGGAAGDAATSKPVRDIQQPPEPVHESSPAREMNVATNLPAEPRGDALPASEPVAAGPQLPTSAAPVGPHYDVLLGDTGTSRQYGLFGRVGNKTVALDLNGTNTISLFGVQGGGKSYTLGSVVEMATKAFPGINLLPSALASVIFHYHESQDYPPEFVSMIAPNSKEDELRILAQEYGAQPDRLEDVVILTSADKVAQRQMEFPSVRVEPIRFSSGELSLKDWRFLMGALGNQMYMKQMNLIMRQMRDQITLDALRENIDFSDLTDAQKNIANTRLDFAAHFIDDTRNMGQELQPGRLVIVDLRDEFIDKDEALGLFVVILNIFASAGRDEGFNKLMVFDEAHKYMNNADLTSHIVDVIRQMRHQGVSVLIASQDPPSLANAIIELSSVVILHRFNSPKWLKHIQQSVSALEGLTPAQLAGLRPGEAFVWATKTTDAGYSSRAVKIKCRPRVTQHGGETKTAV